MLKFSTVRAPVNLTIFNRLINDFLTIAYLNRRYRVFCYTLNESVCLGGSLKIMADQSKNVAGNVVNQTQEYQRAVLDYEALERQVTALLAAHGGVTRNLSDDNYAQYRELAARRDLAYNRVKTLERDLLDES
jgi:hypothetical protein